MTVPKVVAGLCLCAVVTAGRCSGPGDPKPSLSRAFNVMSFNIRYGTANDGPDAWPIRRPHVIAYLRQHGADVIGLQEALRGQLDELRAALPMYAEVGVGRDDGREAGEYAAILFNVTRFELLAFSTFWFSDTPAVSGSRSWGNNVTRICSWARLRDRVAGRSFYVYNVHLDHESQPSRERSVAALKDSIRARRFPEEPVIVTGDFNAGEDNPAARGVAPEFHDAYRVLYPGDSSVGTFKGFRGDSTGPKIDFVFLGVGFEAVEARIDRARTPAGRNLSDHFPVTAVVRFTTPAAVER